MCAINCEPNLKLTCSEFFVISDNTGPPKFTINDAKLYVPVNNLKIEDSAKSL